MVEYEPGIMDHIKKYHGKRKIKIVMDERVDVATLNDVINMAGADNITLIADDTPRVVMILDIEYSMLDCICSEYETYFSMI